MKKSIGYFLPGLIFVCAACGILTAGCSQSRVTTVVFTAGRTSAAVIALLGLIGVVSGGLALARAAGHIGTGSGRAAAIFALLLGLLVTILSVVHLGTATGGFGTGGGRAGAIVALVLGLINLNLGGFALARSRRPRNTD